MPRALNDPLLGLHYTALNLRYHIFEGPVDRGKSSLQIP